MENGCHHTFDAVFREDDRPWIPSNPQGTLVVQMLRRIAYNLLTLFRSVTLRSESARAIPWRELMRTIVLALTLARLEDLDGLRRRLPALAP